MFRAPRSRDLDREILSLALPACGSVLTAIAHTWIDMAWLGRTAEPAEAVAAVSIASFTVWIFSSFASLIAVGATALVARYAGAGRLEGARYAASQALRGAVVLSFGCAALGTAAAPWAYIAAGAAPEVAAHGVPYVRILWGAGIAVLLLRTAGAVFRGYGNTRTPFLINAASLGLNAVLDPLLIFGAGPVPALGTAGAAWATVLSSAASAGFLLFLLARESALRGSRPPDEELRFDESTPLSRVGPHGLDWAMQWRVARIGVPVAGSGIFFSLVYLALAWIVGAAGGTAAVAGLGIGHRGESIAWALSTGYASAAAALVGRSLGATMPEEAARAAWRCVAHCAVLCGAWGLVLLVFADPLAALFIDDGEAHAVAASYFRITSWCLALQAAELVLEGAFGGAGLTVPPMLITGVLSAVRIPLAYAVWASGFGVGAIWWVLAVTAAFRGIVMAIWFARGTWKTRSV